MQLPAHRRSWASWAVALIALALIDAGITRTDLLWAPTRFERSPDLNPAVGQTFSALRSFYRTPDDGVLDVVLVGNSRLMLAANPETLQDRLQRRWPGRPVRVHLVGVFGAVALMQERMSRHLHHMSPDLVVQTLTLRDLWLSTELQLAHPGIYLFATGWRDSPGPPPAWTERIDRWMRTLWPLWRFRELARAALEERVRGFEPMPPRPQFRDRMAVLEFARGAGQAPKVEAAYRRWLAQPDFGRYLEYMQLLHGPDLLEAARRSVANRPSPEDLRFNHEALAATLRLGVDRGWSTQLLLMPENALFEQDRAGDYHPLGFAEGEAKWVAALCRQQGVRFVDGRGWFPVTAFMDLEHLWPDLAGFEDRMVQELSLDVLH